MKVELPPTFAPLIRRFSIVNAVREDHGPGDDTRSICRACGQAMPCDALVLADEVTRARAIELDQRKEIAALETSVARQRAAVFGTLEWIANIGLIIMTLGFLGDSDGGPVVVNVLDGFPFRVAGFMAHGFATMVKGVLQRRIDPDFDRLYSNANIVWGVLFVTLAALRLFAV